MSSLRKLCISDVAGFLASACTNRNTEIVYTYQALLQGINLRSHTHNNQADTDEATASYQEDTTNNANDQ